MKKEYVIAIIVAVVGEGRIAVGILVVMIKRRNRSDHRSHEVPGRLA
mgnify:CR=1 FL=1